MKRTGYNIYIRPVQVVIWVVIAAALYFASTYSYLLFHSVAELFAVFVAFSVFIVGWHTREYATMRIYLLLGVAFFFVGCIDILHTLTYEGMNVFPEVQPNIAIQLWIAARYLESVSLLLAPLLMKKQLYTWHLAIGYSVITGLLLISIFYWQIFPVCYIVGEGLTPFKVTSEYVISGILLCSAVGFYVKRSDFDPFVVRLLIASPLVMIAAEMAFTLYVGLYELPNLVGHYFKIISFYLIYRAVVDASLVKPFQSLFRTLKKSEQWFRERTTLLESEKIGLETHSEHLLQELLDSEERFRNIFNTSPVSISIFDSRGCFVEANKACLKMFKVSKCDYLKELELFNLPNITDEVKKDVRKGRTVRFESVFDLSRLGREEHRDDTKFRIMYVDITICPLQYGKDPTHKGYLVQMQDITKQRKVEEERAINESRMESLLRLNQMEDATLDDIVSFALEEGIRLTKSRIGYVAFVSDDESMLTMHSWSKTAMSECAITDKPRVYQLESIGLWGEAIRQRGPVVTNDYFAPNPAKRGLPVGHSEIKRHMNVPVFDSGKIVIVAGVGNKEHNYDNQDVRQLTLLMQGMWQILQRRRTEALVKAAADTATLYLDLMGHDIRNHLQAISMGGDILKELNLGVEGESMLDIIHDSVSKSSALIDKVQKTRGLLTAPLNTISLDNCIEDAIEEIQRVFSDVVVEVEYMVRGAVVRADEYLERLLVNVMENGVEHNTSRERRLWLRLSEEQDYYVVSISDNGKGISPQKKDSLFDPSRRFGGLGIHQAMKILTKYNGLMSVHDRVIDDSTQGAEFLIRMPRALTQQETSLKESSTSTH